MNNTESLTLNESNIKFLVMDVDGTLTDGKVYMGDDGEIMKAFDIKDGCGIHDILIPAGIRPVIITGRNSKILTNRCKELGIVDVHQGIQNKIEKLEEILAFYSSLDKNIVPTDQYLSKDHTLEKVEKYHYANVAYIGDDINDLSCMNRVREAGGIVGCPADAIKKVIDIADFVSSKVGGNGAVRDFIEWLVAGRS